MFRFSDDESIANKQKKDSANLLESLFRYFTIERCPKIEKFFDDNVKTYEFLEELPKLAKIDNNTIIMPCIPCDSSDEFARMDISAGFNKIFKSQTLWKEVDIPFIEFSFPKYYNCKHGDKYMHVYIFFFTQFTEFEKSRDCTLHYLKKLNKLKAFL